MWDELVEKSPHGTIFHNSEWITTCSKLLDKKLSIFGCFKNDQLIGGCSLFINNKLKFFKTASSTTLMTPYGGVILSQSQSSKVREKEHANSSIIKSLLDVFNNNFHSIIITNPPEFVDVRPFIWNGWNSNILYTYYFNLEKDIEKSISKNVRWSIKKAIKNGITIKKSSDTSLYYDLFSMTFKRQNLNPPVTKEFLEKMINLLRSKNMGEMWIAETPTGEIASAEIIIWDNKRAYRWSAASHTDLKSTGSTSLILYEIFQDLKNRGFKEINLMAANTPHLAKFISSFNPELVPYYVVEKTSPFFKLFTELYGVYKKLKKKL